jgi:ribose-phosphate pyrophosphokinase
LDDPVLIGPDSESEQWVASVARHIGAPFRVLMKNRSGDRSVTISAPDLSEFSHRHPVLLDDILSSGKTLAVAAQIIKDLLQPPTCVVIHALPVSDNSNALLDTAVRLVSTNTVPTKFADIDVVPLVSQAVQRMCAGHARMIPKP